MVNGSGEWTVGEWTVANGYVDFYIALLIPPNSNENNEISILVLNDNGTFISIMKLHFSWKGQFAFVRISHEILNRAFPVSNVIDLLTVNECT